MPGQVKIQPNLARFEGAHEVANVGVIDSTVSSLSEYRMVGKPSESKISDTTKDLLPVIKIEGLD